MQQALSIAASSAREQRVTSRQEKLNTKPSKRVTQKRKGKQTQLTRPKKPRLEIPAASKCDEEEKKKTRQRPASYGRAARAQGPRCVDTTTWRKGSHDG
jgi:hypothetical protein